MIARVGVGPQSRSDGVSTGVTTSGSDDRQAAARAAFARWASLQAGSPRDVDSLVETVDLSHDHAGLLATEVQGRRVVWKSVPASGRSRVTASPVAIETIDPWSVEAGPLRERSDHISICDACGGERRVACAACRGSGKRVCAACAGQRKMYGYTANGAYRLLNCTTCRGKG
ncbi:MAG TPA: hypothetical protein VHL59_06340, partial [Thermoanaerobaculia bacterium]|nr:hypothetical protein [Thermoanaerobaculia bacterium]